MNFLASFLCTLCLLIAGATLGPVRAHAQHHAATGTWYAEFAITNAADPLAAKYDSWKSVSRRHADGRSQIHFRFYKAGSVVSNLIETRNWGGDVRGFWTQCVSYIQDGVQKTCSSRSEYVIEEVNGQQMTYRSRETGRIFRVTRVKDDFVLP